MADVKMPESIPCRFDEHGWAPCNKPSTNGWCTEHEKATCSCCGKHATCSCEAQMGGLACGAHLCDDCTHGPDGVHITRAEAERLHNEDKIKQSAKEASRENPAQMMNEELGVPANLFELLKNADWSDEFEIRDIYYVALQHSLMGFFPAEFAHETHRMVLTPSLHVLQGVWATLDPRESKIGSIKACVRRSGDIGYCDADPAGRENSEPKRLLTEREFNEIEGGGVNRPFQWAAGLIGARHLSFDEFRRSLEQQAVAFEPSFLQKLT